MIETKVTPNLPEKFSPIAESANTNNAIADTIAAINAEIEQLESMGTFPYSISKSTSNGIQQLRYSEGKKRRTVPAKEQAAYLEKSFRYQRVMALKATLEALEVALVPEA